MLEAATASEAVPIIVPGKAVTFTICGPDDDEVLEVEYDEERLEHATAVGSPGPWLTIPNPIESLRRLSDQSLRHARDQMRRLSTTGSKLFKGANLSRLAFLSESSRPPPRVRRGGGQRKMSADPMSILKSQPDLEDCGHHHGMRFGRKSVSFCQRDNVLVYDIEWPEEEEDESSLNDENLEVREPQEGDKSLVPSFVFPGKRPNYAAEFEKTTIILESVDISLEDMCLMGNVRVNLDRLQQAAATKKRVSIVAKYTTNEWTTSKETKAMLVKAQSHPALSHLATKAMRFYIDCDELEAGDVLKFSVMCYASNQPNLSLGKDDNDGHCYQVNCTPKLNIWAARAAQELKNFAPIVKYNCIHKDSTDTSL